MKENGVKVVHILKQALLEELLNLDWEFQATISKVLGIYMGNDISPQRILDQLVDTLEKCLEKAKKNPYSLIVRLQIAKQMVSSKLWCNLQLWIGNMKLVEMFDSYIKDFVWSGQEHLKKPRVDYETIQKLKEEGGLGLIFNKSHTIAMGGKTMLWVVQEGDQTLQCI